MIASPRTRGSLQKSWAAFTLIEIMVAIVIIAILMSLLIPAVQNVMKTARIAEVKTDMDKLTTAMTQFKQRFNVDVPGSVTLYETGTAWTTPGDAEAARSRGIIRQIWPLFGFGNVDFNQNGNSTDVIPLDGAEGLVFFLGGRVDIGAGSGGSGALVGFSKNPINPFAFGGNREGPFFEFKIGRLIDTGSVGFPEYLDPIPGQTNPYLYFAPGFRKASDGGSPASWVNVDNWFTAGSQRMKRAYYVNAMTNTWPAGAQLAVPHNKSSFQIISPGFDYQYGVGGRFDPDNDTNNAMLATEDHDNITNFHSGVLVQ